MASVLPTGVDCVLACGVCPNSREGVAAGEDDELEGDRQQFGTCRSRVQEVEAVQLAGGDSPLLVY